MAYIKSLFSTLFQKISSVVMSVLIALGLVVGDVSGDITGAQSSPLKFKDSENLIMSAVLLADTHIKNDGITIEVLQHAVSDINKSGADFDALVIAGDITDKGDTASYNLVWNNLEKIENLGVILPAIGNHDVRQTFEAAKAQISAKATEYTKKEITEPYYSYDVKGYTFIIMGSDAPASDGANISEEQLAFLDAELQRATESGKPAFVVCHFPLVDTHGLPDVWRNGGDIGAQSNEVKEILTEYKNVFYINGHLHTGIYSASIQALSKDNNVYSVNLPAYGQPNAKGVFKNTGIGVYMEVYEDEVVFTARNFQESLALDGYSKAFEIK